MKVRTFFSALAVVVVLLLAVGIGGFWSISSRSPLGLLRQGGQSVPEASLFVPRQAPLMASFLAAPHRLVDLWQFLAAPQVRSQTQAEIERLERSLLAGTGLSYEKDIRPWLGQEITFALTSSDLDEDSENGQQPGYLLALSCRSRDLAQETLELYWQQRAIAGDNLVFEQFAGSQLISARPVKPTPEIATADANFLAQASALVGSHFVLLANSADVLKQALTTAQTPTLSLYRDTDFQLALNQLPEGRVGMVFANVPQSLRWLGVAPKTRPLTQGLGSADNLFDRAVLSLQLNRQGLLAEAALLGAPGHSFSSFVSQSPTLTAAHFLPEGAPLAVAGRDLAHFWSTASNLLIQYGVSRRDLSTFSWHRASPALDVAFLTNWVQAGYALGLIEAPGNGVDWALAAEHTSLTKDALKQLDQLAQQQRLSIGPVELGEHVLTAWSKLSVVDKNIDPRHGSIHVKTDVTGLRTQVSDYELLTTSITAINRLLQNEASLVDTQLWTAATAPLAQPNIGYFYVDWPRLAPSLRNQLPWLRLLETTGQPLLRHVKAVAATGYSSTPQIRRGAISLYLSNLEAS